MAALDVNNLQIGTVLERNGGIEQGQPIPFWIINYIGHDDDFNITHLQYGPINDDNRIIRLKDLSNLQQYDIDWFNPTDGTHFGTTDDTNFGF